MSIRVCIVLGLLVSLLAPIAGPASAGEFPDDWYYYGGRNPKVSRLRELEGKPAPTLELTGWNVQETAQRLELGRNTVYRKIERYGLRRAREAVGG